MKNDVWEEVQRHEGKRVVGSRWIYKVKLVVDGSMEKYKALFVAKGLSQKDGEHYEDTFTPVARYTFIQDVISIAVEMKSKLHQKDVKTTFMNGIIEEEVYIEKPKGF